MSRFKKYKRNPSVKYRDLTINRDDVQEFLEDVTDTPPCPECAKDFWRVIVTPGENETLVIPAVNADEDGEVGDHYLAVAVVSCDNCGYVKKFTLRTIHNWMVKRLLETELDDE